MNTTLTLLFAAHVALPALAAPRPLQWPPKVHHLAVKAPGMRPTLGFARDTLVVGMSDASLPSGGAIHLFKFSSDFTTWSETRIEGSRGNVGMAVDAVGGRVANCTDLGNTLHVIDVVDPARSFVHRFDFMTELSCAGISFDPAEPGEVWIGSTGNRTIAKIDARNGRASTRIAGVSGPFKLKKVGNHVFTSNGLIMNDGGFTPDVNMPIPLVLDARSGATVVGDKLGDTSKTGLKRHYNFEIFDDSAHSGKVYYLDLVAEELVGFDARNPRESTAVRHKTGLGNALRVVRHGRCLVISSLSPDEWLYPRWSVFKDDGKGGFTHEGTTPYLEDKALNGAIESAIDPAGNVYLSHWDGVSRIEGLTDGYGCN